ncbi:MAG: hypothetical protein ABIJ09_16725 [Pseudomonadota bacterium]
MRTWTFLVLLVTAACQPQAPRLGVERAVYKQTANQVTTTSEWQYHYGDGPLLGGKPLASAELTLSTSGSDVKDRAHVTYSYSEERLTRYDQSSDNDNLDSVGQFLYRPNGKLQKIETDSGPNGDIEVNIEAAYDAEDNRMVQLAYKWELWIFRVNERADVRYDADGRIMELDGGDLFIRYEWNEGQLTRIEVQQRNGDDMDYRLSYKDGQVQEIVDGDDRWNLSYDDQGRMTRIESTLGGEEQSAEYSYVDHAMLNMRVAPRLPIYVNFVLGLDGRALTDLDFQALPDYFN